VLGFGARIGHLAILPNSKQELARSVEHKYEAQGGWAGTLKTI
jgi:hypothetical protein